MGNSQACKDHRFQNLYRLLDANLLLDGWDGLDKQGASGVDGVTAAAYEQELIANIQDLVERLKTKRYRTRLVRRCYIPKDNGGERPLGIPALEDKLVLSHRIDDKAFLSLIRQWLKAGILETDGQILHPVTGSRQGGSISPILANVYWHHVLDLWFEKVVKPRCGGQALLIRYVVL